MNPLGLFVAVLTLGVAYVAATSWSIRQRAMQRLYADEEEQLAAAGLEPSGSEGWLARWLSLSGYRRPNAPVVFVGSTVFFGCMGFVVGQLYRSILLRPLLEAVATAPGSTGDVLAAILQGGPWILFFGAAALPTILVRATRR